MWIPLKDYCKQYPWPKIATLRWTIWRIEGATGKQAPFVTRFGKRLLIDADLFQAWITTKACQDIKEKLIEQDRVKREAKK